MPKVQVVKRVLAAEQTTDGDTGEEALHEDLPLLDSQSQLL
jgi:hypothetical protein